MHSNSRKDQPVAPNGRHVVGIDVGKYHHAASAVTAAGSDFGRQLSFQNNRAGIDHLEQQLFKLLGAPANILIGMEATGHYWMPLYFELKRRGYDSIVINPIQTRAKFRTRIRKTKNDKLDARSIARLVLSGEAKAARIPAESTLELRILTRQRWRWMDIAGDLEHVALSLIDRLFPEYADVFSKPFLSTGKALIREYGLDPKTLQEHRAQLPDFLKRVSRNKLSRETIDEFLRRAQTSIGLPIAQAVLAEQLKSTLSMIDTLDAQILQLDEELERRVKTLKSPLSSLGLNAPLIATIHAESDPMADFAHVWQFAAYTGLDPATYDSGRMHGTRIHISKRGSPNLRRALYLSAFAIYRQKKDLLRLYQKMRKAGHHHVDALVIVAHKLARIVWRLLTDNRPFKAKPPRTTLTKTPLAAAAN